MNIQLAIQEVRLTNFIYTVEGQAATAILDGNLLLMHRLIMERTSLTESVLCILKGTTITTTMSLATEASCTLVFLHNAHGLFLLTGAMMDKHTQEEITLWKMYIWSGVAAISKAADADGVVILQVEQGREFCFPFYMKDSMQVWVQGIIDTLMAEATLHIPYLIYIWKNHWLDVPAADLRKKMISLHPENKNTLILLIGEEGFVVKTLSQIDHPTL